MIAARFLVCESNSERALQFLCELRETSLDQRRIQLKSSYWAEIFQEVVCTVSAASKKDHGAEKVDPETAKEAFNILSEFHRTEEISLDRTQELAQLAFHAKDFSETIAIWKELKLRLKESDPAFILRAKAMITPYPQNLAWYKALNDSQSIVQEYETHLLTNLEEEHRKIVIDALVEKEKFFEAAQLNETYGSWEECRELLCNLPESKSVKDAAFKFLDAYLSMGVKNGEFRQIIEDLKVEKSKIKFLTSIMSNDIFRIQVEAWLIKLLARSQRLIDERADSQFISGTIFNLAKKQSGNLRFIISPEEIGAALERTGRFDNVLQFYESIFEGKQWGSDRDTEYKAKERWLKCKLKQADIDHKNPQRSNQRRSEAKRKSADWGIPFPKEEYPVLPDLSKFKFDQFIDIPATPPELKNQSPQYQVALAATTAVSSEPKNLSYPDAKIRPSESIPTVEQDSDLNETANISPKSGRIDTDSPVTEHDLLSARPSVIGRIEFFFNYEEFPIKSILFPLHRRLELRNDHTNDLLIIKADRDFQNLKPEVQSSDLKVSQNTSKNIYIIKEWSLNIAFAPLSKEAMLVDLFDAEGARILCLVL